MLFIVLRMLLGDGLIVVFVFFLSVMRIVLK